MGRLERFRLSGGIFNIFLIICKIILLFEIFSDLAINRRSPRRPSWVTTVPPPTAVTHGDKVAANSPL
jgi:hypothetical protein